MVSKVTNEWMTIRAKVKRSTFIEMQNYCQREGIKSSKFIRDLIESNVSAVVPVNHAGINKIEYDKRKDTFSWHVEHDNGPRIQIADSLQPSFLDNLLREATQSKENRLTYLRQSNPDSVPVPTRLKKLKGEN
ncbi:MAG: hypothetical protein IPJ89_03695 [Candidatus Iainarchaeum archaeon]|uniref:Uncharacterized protein n=1 Tax=Candidatus Iainarchaeum sp. TaxID=3101447 RepID=A0A7T9DJ13_9ARCH|nr:MAG: hypothetical protein IPJ89_03695 [Candidatus Diapherotrites archaeon]